MNLAKFLIWWESLDIEIGDGGGLRYEPVSVSFDYTASDGDFVLADASADPITITLPSPTKGATVIVKKTDSSANAVTVNTAAGSIDGKASITIDTQYQTVTFISDDLIWYIV